MKQVFTKHIGKQQYLYIALAIIGMCFAGASLVLAEEDATTTRMTQPAAAVSADANADPMKRPLFEERQKALEEKRAAFEKIQAERAGMIEEKRTEIQARIAERKAALGEKAQQRITMLAGVMAQRFENVTGHLSEITARIESRLEKLEHEGKDTDEASLFVAEARQKLAEAQSLIGELDVEVEYTVTSDDPKADWAGAREEFKKVHTLIMEVRELLRQAVAALKDARTLPAATTDATATTSAE